jgi:hypothetical protein
MGGQQLITIDSLATYSGLSMAVIFVTNGIILAFRLKRAPPWLGLLISLIICIGTAFLGPQSPGFAGTFIAVLNAFLVYATALGGNTIAAKAATLNLQSSGSSKTPQFGDSLRQLDTTPKRPFFQQWL